MAVFDRLEASFCKNAVSAEATVTIEISVTMIALKRLLSGAAEGVVG